MTSRRAALALPSEAQLQTQIVQGLELLGYTVLQCGRYVRQTRCPHCGTFHTPHSGFGNTVGCPDLFASHPRWRLPLWIGLELKTPAVKTLLGAIPGGRVRKEQQALAAMGLIVVVRSLEEAQAALARVSAVFERETPA